MGTRRVVTGTNPDGRSYIVSDSAAPTGPSWAQASGVDPDLVANVTDLWTTSPAEPLGGECHPDQFLPAPGGANFRIGGPPFLREPSAWHTTPTVDYEIILEGEIILELDEGAVTLKPGDTVVQGACNHRWIPVPDKPCRMLVVMVSTAVAQPA